MSVILIKCVAHNIFFFNNLLCPLYLIAAKLQRNHLSPLTKPPNPYKKAKACSELAL
ncbi:hypothetical protein OFO16_10845 [Vibrio natriegens]|uniref:hypothetical protein n=1 Tax=Vibrio natriegens TaxID=691 RepID=UPI0021E790BA|nr:hypothetical protein [Vibrio natriegens]UYI48657.1 hypothetical protein OFO16_10845 [Vibrio natriegens]